MFSNATNKLFRAITSRKNDATVEAPAAKKTDKPAAASKADAAGSSVDSFHEVEMSDFKGGKPKSTPQPLAPAKQPPSSHLGKSPMSRFAGSARTPAQPSASTAAASGEAYAADEA